MFIPCREIAYRKVHYARFGSILLGGCVQTSKIWPPTRVHTPLPASFCSTHLRDWYHNASPGPAMPPGVVWPLQRVYGKNLANFYTWSRMHIQNWTYFSLATFSWFIFFFSSIYLGYYSVVLHLWNLLKVFESKKVGIFPYFLSRILPNKWEAKHLLVQLSQSHHQHKAD